VAIGRRHAPPSLSAAGAPRPATWSRWRSRFLELAGGGRRRQEEAGGGRRRQERQEEAAGAAIPSSALLAANTSRDGAVHLYSPPSPSCRTSEGPRAGRPSRGPIASRVSGGAIGGRPSAVPIGCTGRCRVRGPLTCWSCGRCRSPAARRVDRNQSTISQQSAAISQQSAASLGNRSVTDW
jgi:hypothetical protein